MIKRDNVKDIYPLTAFQEGLAFHDLLEGESQDGPRAYFQQMRFNIRGPLDVAALDKAFSAVVARHDILRTVFRLLHGQKPLQVVLKHRDFKCEVIDLSSLGSETQAAELTSYVEDERARPFDLQRDILLRVGLVKLAPALTHVVMSFHHILMDGWCIGILQNDLTLAYRAFSEGRTPEFPPAQPFSAFVKASLARRDQAGLDYWRGYLAGFDQAVTLPIARPAMPERARDVRTHRVELSEDLTQRLLRLAQANGATFNCLIQSLWGVLLAKLEDREDVVFGAMASTRPLDMPGADTILGPCIGMLPLRVQMRHGECGSDFLRRMQAERIAWLENVHCALADIQTLTPLRQDLIGHYFVFENYPLEERFTGEAQELAPGVTICDVQMFQSTNYDFGVVALPGQSVKIDFTFNASRVDPAGVARLGVFLERLAVQLAEDPSSAIEDLSLLDRGERERLLALGLGPALPDRPRDIRALRREVAAHRGSMPALRAGGRTLSHAELERSARRLAACLVKTEGVSADAPVALHSDAGEGLVTAMLACLLLGVPYVPLDPQSPAARNGHIIGASGARLILSSAPESLAEIETHARVQSLTALLEASLSYSPDSPLPPMPEEPTAYIIFTSGTTGVPKGVRVGHASLIAYVRWLVGRFGEGAELRSALLTSPAFDLGYTAVFGALLSGGALSLFDEDERRDPTRVLEAICADRLTLLKMTPSYLSMLRSAPGAEAAFRRAADLRLFLLGGEAQNFADLKWLKDVAPHLEVANHYGPTEATIGCVSGTLDDLAQAGDGPQRIGKPIAGARLFVCDQSQRLVPFGIAGELLVAGEGLAQGYLNAGAEDAARFTRLDWCGGLRAYRTGDKVRWLEDGNLEFLGRMDDQVKIRGYRVSLKEVEAALRALAGVRDAAVVTDLRGGLLEMSAYVILDPASPPTPATLREKLLERVPPAMVPSRFLPVSRFPMTANGKLDRKALAEHWRSSAPAGDAEAPEAAGSVLEESLRDIWKDVLFMERVGLDDDFFALGGHSLKAILVVSKVKALLGRNLKLRDLFDHPTVRGLAARLEQPQSEPGSERLLRLRAGSSAAPVAFFFPPALGTSTLYRDLVEPLDRDVSCYGLQAPGFDADAPFLPSLAALADHFAALIAPVQSEHPLRLVGWSLGAHFALETARRLEDSGRKVRLILLDAAPVEPGRQKLAPKTFTELRTTPYWGRVMSILEKLPPDELERIERLARHNHEIVHAAPAGRPIGGDIVCLEAIDAPARAGMAGLRAATGGSFTLHEVGGDHYSMFHPPHVHTVLALLRNVLAANAPDGSISAARTSTPSEPVMAS